MDSLLFFLLAHLVLADHRSNVGGGLKTTNAEHLIFGTEECIMKMHCAPILRTTKRYCSVSLLNIFLKVKNNFFLNLNNLGCSPVPPLTDGVYGFQKL